MAGIFGLLESSATQWYQDVGSTQEFFIITSIVYGERWLGWNDGAQNRTEVGLERSCVPFVARPANLGAVVERHANGPVRQLERKSVLVAVIDPLRDEQRLRPESRGWIGADTCAGKKRFVTQASILLCKLLSIEVIIFQSAWTLAK